MLRGALHLFIIAVLTILTQIGGLAWAASLAFRWKRTAFLVIYAVLSVATVWTAPQFGRVALSCFADGPLQVQSWIYCGLNRNYVSPELKQVLSDTASAMDRRFPGTETLVLDANFPFFDGFPLLPHLSHDDGEKADLAFYYADDSGYLRGQTRSPIGYFAFEDGPTDCPDGWLDLRWDLAVLQPLWAGHRLDTERNRDIVLMLSQDARIGKVFVEPHLVRELGVSAPAIRFQGCNAARHDDHIHLQLR